MRRRREKTREREEERKGRESERKRMRERERESRQERVNCRREIELCLCVNGYVYPHHHLKPVLVYLLQNLRKGIRSGVNLFTPVPQHGRGPVIETRRNQTIRSVSLFVSISPPLSPSFSLSLPLSPFLSLPRLFLFSPLPPSLSLSMERRRGLLGGYFARQ